MSSSCCTPALAAPTTPASHVHHHQHDLSRINAEYWKYILPPFFPLYFPANPASTDSHALAIHSPWVAAIHSQMGTFLTTNLPFLSLPGGTLLDYACGSGLASLPIAPQFTRIVGIDVAPEMISKFNATYSGVGIEARGVVGDIMTGGLPEETGFDAVLCSMALHHMADVEDAVARLAGRVRVGGVVVLIDWAEGDVRGGTAAETMPQGAIVKMEEALLKAGCEGVEVRVLEAESEVPDGKGMRLGFARGTRKE